MTDLSSWDERWKSLKASLDHIITRIENPQIVPKDLPRRDTIYCLLKNLQSFGGSHFNYFYSRLQLANSNLELNLEHNGKIDHKYPVDAVLRSIIDQIAFDLEVIRRALNQRLLPDAYEPRIINALNKADKLGQIALQPAIDSGLIDKGTTVLTYFQKSTTVRVIPYAKVAIIGLPLTALDVPQDYLAIPHEVAHFIYRHGTLKNGRSISSELNRKYKSRLKYMRNWLEEMFADIYGCLVAGPVIALDFQDLQLDDPLEDFANANVDHEDPVPVIRPDIHTKILYLRTGDRSELAGFLQSRWNKKRNAYMNRKAGEDLKFRTGNTEIKLDDIRQEGQGFDTIKKLDNLLDSMIRFAFEDVKKKINGSDSGYLNWSGNTNGITEANLKNLYNKFNKTSDSITQVDEDEKMDFIRQNPGKAAVWLPDLPYVADPLQVDVSLQAHNLHVSRLWVDYVKTWTIRNGFTKMEDRNKVNQLLTKKRPPRAEDSESVWGWLNLAYADGWVTRGPEPNPTGD